MSFTERVKSQSRDSLNSFEGSQQATAEESALGCPPSSPLVGDAQSAQSPDNLETQLETLRLKVSPETQKDITNVLESLKDIISTTMVCMVSDEIDSEEEAKMWSCFSEVYLSEVEAQRKDSGEQPDQAQKRQIFADILVWAEVSRPGYDAAAAEFVTGPHVTDVSFKRIGAALVKAKQSKGVTRL